MSTLENTPYLSPVSDDSAKQALRGTRFADLGWVDSTGSTNADLVDAARSGAGERALVADHQSAGRGRLDRRWEAPPGASLLMSVLVRPPFPALGAHLLGTAMGLCAVDAVEHLAGLGVGLKWPNDVVAIAAGADGADLKLGGLLAELTTGEGGDAVVVGIGLNVGWASVGFPPELAATATSVDLLGAPVDRGELVVELLTRFGDLVTALVDATACEHMVERYRERCVTLGRRVRVQRPADELVGVAADVSWDGSLVVRDDEGVAHTVTVGDVVHLRPV
jgi:BirA family transcriptional regulator, biotin operon repressor / biotin---[acetyl-CoA-carboxylase] ligase